MTQSVKSSLFYIVVLYRICNCVDVRPVMSSVLLLLKMKLNEQTVGIHGIGTMMSDPSLSQPHECQLCTPCGQHMYCGVSVHVTL